MQFDVEAILFDNDGVLVDSHDLVEAAWRLLAEEFDLRIEVLLGELAGVPAADTLGGHLDPERAQAAVARLEDIEVTWRRRRPSKPGQAN